ncbi:MAG: M48 family metallopeptidase, partial [Leptospiraceae bacterium]|nr:M48 family metallopeptidase [Leptospiraceae bacterium]
MKTKKEYIQGIGFIEVKRWKSSKNIKLSFKPGHGFLLTYPYSSNKSSALKIIKIHRNWIDKIKEKYDNFEVKDLEIQEKKLLKVKLEKRLKELSKAHNLPYNKFFLRKMRSRWGSCSG